MIDAVVLDTLTGNNANPLDAGIRYYAQRKCNSGNSTQRTETLAGIAFVNKCCTTT